MQIRQSTIFLVLMFSLGCFKKAPIDATEMTDPTSIHRRLLNHDGIEREYFIHVPDGISLPAPVVYAVHGFKSTATGFEAAHSMNPHAVGNDYIAVYPNGSHFVVDTEMRDEVISAGMDVVRDFISRYRVQEQAIQYAIHVLDGE